MQADQSINIHSHTMNEKHEKRSTLDSQENIVRQATRKGVTKQWEASKQDGENQLELSKNFKFGFSKSISDY